MVNTLQTGADNLVLADNLEGANMLALQTRQSLSTTALARRAGQPVGAPLRLRPIRGQKIGGGAKSPAVFIAAHNLGSGHRRRSFVPPTLRTLTAPYSSRLI